MPQKLIGLIVVFVLGLATAVLVPTSATAVPAGLTPADWAHIQSQLAPQAVAAWNQQAKLSAGDAAMSDEFGFSVAVDGNTAVIGARLDDDGGSNSGSAYIFTRTDGVWSQQAKLTASDSAAEDSFGHSVAISGDTAVVGVPEHDNGGSNYGSAYIFVRSGGSWSQQAKLTASDSAAEDNFGYAVAVSGDTAVVGAALDDDGGSNSGAAYVFVRSGESWSEQAKLIANDSAAGAMFGVSVAVSGNTAVVGAYLDNGGSPYSGSAYVFSRTGEAWSQQTKLIASDFAGYDNFGVSVALSGDTAVIGAYGNGDGVGAAYVFTRSGAMWSEQAKLTASDGAPNDLFGVSVAISGDIAVVGAHLDDNGDFDNGSAYVFERSGESWSQQTKLTASDGAESDVFGISVAVSGGTAVVGAIWDDDGGNNSGSVYIFSISSTPAQLLTVATAGDGSGHVVSNPVGTTFPQGSEVTLTAVADSGSTFTGWSGDVTSSTNPLIVTLDSDKFITATFALASTPTVTLSESCTNTNLFGTNIQGEGWLPNTAVSMFWNDLNVLIPVADAEGNFQTGWSVGSIYWVNANVQAVNELRFTQVGGSTKTVTVTRPCPTQPDFIISTPQLTSPLLPNAPLTFAMEVTNIGTRDVVEIRQGETVRVHLFINPTNIQETFIAPEQHVGIATFASLAMGQTQQLSITTLGSFQGLPDVDAPFTVCVVVDNHDHINFSHQGYDELDETNNMACTTTASPTLYLPIIMQAADAP